MKPFKVIPLFLISAAFLMACSFNSETKEDQSTIGSEVADILSGNEIYISYDFAMQMPSSDSLKPAGNIKLYLSDEAVRSEMKMSMFGTDQALVMLGNFDKPDETILLNSENKTYKVMEIKIPSDMQSKMDNMTTDSLVVVGEEKMNGYNCTHLKVITTTNLTSKLGGAIGAMLGGSDKPSVTEYWVSTDVPGNDLMSKLVKSRPSMMKGVDNNVYQYGIPVKMITKDGATNMTMLLTKAKKQNIAQDKFEIPTGYTEIKDIGKP